MSHHDFHPWDPKEAPDGDHNGPPGGDQQRIVRRVRLYFLLSALLAGSMVVVGLRPLMPATPLVPPSLTVVAAMGVVLLALLALGWWNLRPDRLVAAGKRALDAEDPRERRPKLEAARKMGLLGLAASWTAQAIAVAMLPVFVGLLLQVLARQTWPLLSLTGLAVLAGVLYERRIRAAVREAGDDEELRRAYGPR